MMRIGHGYDVHRLIPGRKLILGGVHIPHPLGLEGHSDADCLLHAIADALLGAAALGDIGQWFPDTDPVYKGADSQNLLKTAYQKVLATGWSLSNLDVTVIAQAPKLAAHLPRMREIIAQCLDVDVFAVNLKATTHEHLGALGRQEGIAAHAVCLLVASKA